MKTQDEQWTSRLGFILAAAGSAIGLGAIWKFPYMVGMGGGGAFLLLFIAFTLLVGLPLLLAEFVIGRSTGKVAIPAYQEIAPKKKWYLLGYLGMVSCGILLSFYAVVGGWILLYLFKAITGQLMQPAGGYGELFNTMIANPYEAVGAHFIFILLTIIVVARGVQDGIEKSSKYLMPALFVLFLALIVRSLTLENAIEGVKFFLLPDFAKLDSKAILFALGQSFFSLSVGVSVMATYSSYLSKKESLTRSAYSIAGLNVLISLFAGLAIFPAIFSLGMEPSQGPGLLFVVLPSVFEKIPLGSMFLLMFLALFLFATLTSAFSMLEIIVANLTKGNPEQRKKWSWVWGLIIFIVGIPAALSFGIWADIKIFGLSFFDASDYLVSNILMPMGCLLIAIFVPLRMKRQVLLEELQVTTSWGKKMFVVWLMLLRYLVPFVIIIVFLNAIGIIGSK
ncbi:sodium-dependent transporter [Paenibacillus sp. N1-5-1-14]|uniref:sodium-dependent transporter n=1 Tax=Paenibacillus radicibacter TaxID=2972488 RepID=UPI002158F1D1|nr:sodium-dependent transporter [Paenibacillus radicibacter]MCR8644043.1 sodium-dependent transporter [Paenibacillus radicibacter]